PARRIQAGYDPAHLPDAVAAAPRPPGPRRALQCLLPPSAPGGGAGRAPPPHNVEWVGGVAPGREVAIRLNPGLGSGATNRTNTGGPASSFGIWHEYLDEARRLAAQNRPPTRTTHRHPRS